jgi:glycosyltransferase involved in cell wall biosynthesis
MANTLETGGSERQFVTMAHALDQDQFSVILGCIQRTGPLVEEVEEVIEFSPGGNLFGPRSWQARLRLARFLREKQVRVAHACDFYSNLMLIPAARWAGVPVVLGSHRQLGDLMTTAKFRTQRHAFRFCDRVVCNSRAAADSLRAAGVHESKLAVIPNGLPDAVFAQYAPVLPADPTIFRIGMISRMNDPVKRHDMFLRVAARLAPKFPQMQFVLVGDGPRRPGLEQLHDELGLAGRVTFLGDRRDVPAVLASLDVSVLPSASESLSNVILESMAAGVAVIAAKVGGNPELIEDGHTGLLFVAGDEDKFAAALERLATQPDLRRQLATAARERAKARFSINVVRQQFQDLYQELLSQKSRVDLVRHEPTTAVKSTREGLSR